MGYFEKDTKLSRKNDIVLSVPYNMTHPMAISVETLRIDSGFSIISNLYLRLHDY